MTTSESIMKIFGDTPYPLALHEIKVWGSSESATGARVRELTQAGKLKNRFRSGENYKEWFLASRAWPNEPKSEGDQYLLAEVA